MSLIRNKTLIVTGASTGIGREVSLALAARGAALVLNAREKGEQSRLAHVCHACAELGARVAGVAGNVGDEATAQTLAETAQRLGPMGGFIHAAGVLHPGPTLWELEPEKFDEIFAAALRGSYLLVRHVVPLLLEQGAGLAVFFGSGAAQIVQPGIAAYCAAKAAEEHLMRQLAAEAPAVCSFVYRPGIVDTRMQEQARQSSGGAAEQLRRVFVPWKEQGELLSPAASAQGLMLALEHDSWLHHSAVVSAQDLLAT